MPVSYPYVIPAFFAPFMEKHGRRPVASDLTAEQRSQVAACIGMNYVAAYLAGEPHQPDLALMECVDEGTIAINRVVVDPPWDHATGVMPVDRRALEAKKDLIRKALHTAWGQCKESPSYQKCWWRVLAAVLENLTCSTDLAALKILTELSIPSDPERPA